MLRCPVSKRALAPELREVCRWDDWISTQNINMDDDDDDDDDE